MGVISPYKTFTFDGESSADYGVYLTGEGVFNAPERSVEMVEIPGRNGNFALDKGKFENISVIYRVGMFDDDEENFADKVSAFRNWLCSKVGYVRLSDDYNPNEYRMAVYLSGLELEHDFLIAGEAQITFDCKPQRWLTSGETAVSVADGGTLDNPTLFESEPLITYDGYGTIEFNGYTIETDDVVLGDVVLTEKGEDNTFTIDESIFNVGDTVTLSSVQNYMFNLRLKIASVVSEDPVFYSQTLTDSNSNFTSVRTSAQPDSLYYSYKTNVEPFNIVIGTSSSVTNTMNLSLVVGNHYKATITAQVTQTVSYNAQTHTITWSSVATTSTSDATRYKVQRVYHNYFYSAIGHSSLSIATDTKHIDCEIGEVYTIKNGEIVPMNDIVALGSDLPKLVSGTNTFNYDNTITNFTVTPRWWKV